MPPHLHPRSKLTSSLFATTLFASFFVVALPHVLPCPAPRIAFADGECPDGTRRRRRRSRVEKEQQDSRERDQSANESRSEESSDDEAITVKPKGGVCPIPKPGGIVGEILGFKNSSSGGKGEKPP